MKKLACLPRLTQYAHQRQASQPLSFAEANATLGTTIRQI